MPLVKTNSGYVTLLTVLVVAAIGITLIITILNTSFELSKTRNTQARGLQAQFHLETCLEQALQYAHENPAFEGVQSLSINPQVSCGYEIALGTPDNELKATLTMDDITRRGYVTYTVITQDDATHIEISSWQDVSSFDSLVLGGGGGSGEESGGGEEGSGGGSEGGGGGGEEGGSTPPTCTTFGYVDEDDDGFGVGEEICVDELATYSNIAGDCYDQNSTVRPDQTSWFSSHRGDGSYDYNCSGANERRWTQTASGRCTSGSSVCAGYNNKWSSVPGCGASGQIFGACQLVEEEICVGSNCFPSFDYCPTSSSRTQQCH